MADYNDDGEVCRVCRTEAEPDNPLYHPCKCSGSIRYVHSECLVQWLGHSHKKTCELCGHAFSFKKVYPADMPPSLPLPTLVLQFLKDGLRVIAYGGWAILVAFVWLVFLPLIIKGVWGGLFSGGDSMIGKMVGDQTNSTKIPAFNRTETAEDLKDISAWLATANIDADDIAAEVAERMSKTERVPRSRVGWGDGVWAVRTIFYNDPKVRSLMFKTMRYQIRNYIRDTLLSNVFQGQILAVVIVLTFLGIFLVREWVIQNGPIDNPAADAPEMGGPVRPEDFLPQMAVRWRLRPQPRTDMDPIDEVDQAEHAELNQLEARVDELMAAVERRVAERRAGPDGGNNTPLEPSVVDQEDDDEWEDESDDDASVTAMMERDQGAAFPRTQDYDDEAQVDDVFPMDVDQPDSPNLDTMREARNRYFAVADHNRHFADQAPEAPEASSARSVTVESRPRSTYQSDFTFDFNVDDVNRVGSASFGEQQASGGDTAPAMPRVPQWRPDDTNGDLPAGFNQQYNRVLDPRPRPPPQRPPWLEPVHPFVGQDLPAGVQQPIFPPELRNRAGDPAAPDAPPRGGRRLRQAGRRERVRRVVREQDEVVQGVEERWNDFEGDVDGEGEGDGFILEGDIDGAMEVVGLRGPPVVLLQNTFIVVLVLTAALTVFVHVPYVLGRIHLVGDISMFDLPARGLFAVAKIITVATDLMITGLAKILDYMLIHPLGVILGLSPKQAVNLGVPSGSSKSAGPLVAFFGLLKKALSFVQNVSPAFIGNRIAQMTDLTERGFASLGTNYLHYQQVTRELARGNSSTSRLMCIAMGYFDAFCTVAFLSGLGEPVLGRFGKAISETAISHGTVLKLGFFMLIELAFFPMSMGYIVDLCALPLFPAGTLSARLAVQQRHPLLSFFAHWLCGTLFMFAFAKFLSMCRAVCRRGAMYMIRDPQDPNFSPVRDILDKSTLLQLQKLLISAFMYITVLVGPIGGLFMAIRCLPSSIQLLPLRWYYKETTSTVPVDFILVLFLVPAQWRQLRPAAGLRYLLRNNWRTLARMLRLSSYFYGVRYKEQEVEGPIERKLLALHKKWITLKRAVTRSSAPLPKYEGMQMRVPYADSVALVKPRRNVFVEVDDSGVPVTDEGKITAVLQDRVGRKAHRRVKEDYTQVYMPGLYPQRFWIFGMALWVSIAWTCALAFFIPIVVGRGATALWFGYQVHDGYSFFVGLTILQNGIENIKALRQELLGRKSIKSGTHATMAQVRARVAEAERVLNGSEWTVHKFVRRVSIYTACYVALPFAVGLSSELYVLFPLKYGVSDMTPVFYASEAWAFGFLVSSIVYYRPALRKRFIIFLATAYGEADMAREDSVTWCERAHQGEYGLKPAGLLIAKWAAVALVGPALAALVGSAGLGLDERQGSLLFRFVYPTILTLYLVRTSSYLAVLFLKKWSLRALESVYLVEKRVMNMEEAEKAGGVEMAVREDGVRAADVAAEHGHQL